VGRKKDFDEYILNISVLANDQADLSVAGNIRRQCSTSLLRAWKY
jgi:hypothetical protein